MKYNVGDIIPFELIEDATNWVNSIDGSYYLEDYTTDVNGNMQLIVKKLTSHISSFEEVKMDAISRIDSATSESILAGFDFMINNEVLHFSYDQFDQINFSDAANVATLSLNGVEGLPQTVTWNGYRNYASKTDCELVRITLTSSNFLILYTQGALTHKSIKMENGGRRKAQIEDCKTIEEIQSLLKEWNI